MACPGIRKGRAENRKCFFLLFNISRGGGGAAQKIAENMIFPTKEIGKI